MVAKSGPPRMVANFLASALTPPPPPHFFGFVGGPVITLFFTRTSEIDVQAGCSLFFKAFDAELL